MRNYRTVFFGLALTLAIAGCATILTGTTQPITISSNVDGAKIFLDGVMIGRTPFTGTVKKNQKQLRVEAEGYRSETITLSTTLVPVFWRNIILGGTVGSITDFATGAAYQYAPASYQVELREEGQSDSAYLRQLGTRKLAIVFIDPISVDLAAGGGEYLKALIEISGLGNSRRLTEKEIYTAMTESRGNRIEFGNMIVELL